MKKTREQHRKYQEALDQDIHRDTEKKTAEALGIEGKMHYSWRARRDVPRAVKECPPNYSMNLATFLKIVLKEDPDQRESVTELLVIAKDWNNKSQFFFTPLPMWFQMASRASIAEEQQK